LQGKKTESAHLERQFASSQKNLDPYIKPAFTETLSGFSVKAADTNSLLPRAVARSISHVD
jgi:hypothetical protein